MYKVTYRYAYNILLLSECLFSFYSLEYAVPTQGNNIHVNLH